MQVHLAPMESLRSRSINPSRESRRTGPQTMEIWQKLKVQRPLPNPLPNQLPHQSLCRTKNLTNRNGRLLISTQLPLSNSSAQTKQKSSHPIRLIMSQLATVSRRREPRLAIALDRDIKTTSLRFQVKIRKLLGILRSY